MNGKHWLSITLVSLAGAATIFLFSTKMADSGSNDELAGASTLTRTKNKIAAPAKPVYRVITPSEAMKRIKAGEKIILLDVRTPQEHAEKSIPGSLLLPVEPKDLLSAEVEKVIPNKDATVFVYCRSGRRSANAVRIMMAKGYTNVYDLGGINSWPYETVKK